MAEESNLIIIPKKINARLESASDFSCMLKVENADGSETDLSDYSAEMQIRPMIASKKVFDELTTENGRISIGEHGIIALKFPASVTAGYEFDDAVYDLFVISPDGQRAKVSYGTVTVKMEVTRRG